MPDRSNGYDEHAAEFIAARSRTIGVDVVTNWAATLPPGSAVLDVGCGSGVPISKALSDAGFELYAIDGSPRMIAEFQRRFPNAPTECADVGDSTFFHRTFDAVIAWGLIFLLPAAQQRRLIAKVAAALNPAGRFLFTAPKETATWNDSITGRTSISLGFDEYTTQITNAGLTLISTAIDDGQNHYYLTEKSH